MKNFRILFLLFVINFFTEPIQSQFDFKFEMGSSTFIPHPTSSPYLKKEWARQKFIRAYRVTLMKKFKTDHLELGLGPSLSFYGADQVFIDRWRFVYGGIRINTQYKINKVKFGLASTPSIQLLTNIGLGFERAKTYNFDIEPNFTLNFEKDLWLTLAVSYGLNPAIPFGPNLSYAHLAYLAGISYTFNGKRN